MKRFFVCAVAATFALGTFAVAGAAKKKGSEKQSLTVPVSKRSVKKTALAIPKVPALQQLTPIPEDPAGPLFAPPPIGPDEAFSEIPPSPLPSDQQLPQVVQYHPIVEAPGIPLFKRVRYVGERKKAPGAVSKLIVIKDPCQRIKKSCATCEQCVAIEICVPACACERVSRNKSGNRIRYNYGNYGVEVRIKNGRIVVAYHKR